MRLDSPLIFDTNNVTGLIGSVLSSTSLGVLWTAPTTGTLILSYISGSISANQVAYGVAASQIQGSNSLWFTGTNLGIGTSSPTQSLHIVNGFRLGGSFYDSTNSPGFANSVLVSTITGVAWTYLQPGTSASGSIGGTIGINQIAYGVGISQLGGSNNFVFTGTQIGIGITTPTQSLDINGSVRFRSTVFDINSSPGFAYSVLLSTSNGIAWSNWIEVGNPPSSINGFTSGLLNITPLTAVPDAFNSINQLLALIAPSQASLLTGNFLGNTVFGFSAKLPYFPVGAINSSWYAGGANSGSTVSGYIVSGTYNVLNTTGLPTGGFRAGTGTSPTTYGILQHKMYSYTYPVGYATDTIDMTIHYVPTYTSGTLSLTVMALYNTIWQRANATITYTQQNEGWEGHSLNHTLAGECNQAAYYFDITNSSPSFSTGPVATVAGAAITKYLSGISYFTFNSQFFITFQAAPGIFNRAYHPTAVCTISQTGMNNQFFNPSITPTYYDAFNISNGIVTLNVTGATMNKFLNVAIQKPTGVTSTLPASISSAICTFGTVSTTTSDQFFDEAQRLIIDVNTSWTSSTALSNGNAQVRNGTLQFPNSTDYPGFSAAQEYQRWITKASTSIGTITLTGLTYTNVSAYSSGHINILLYLDGDARYFDLGVTINGTRDGLTRATAYAGQNVAASSGTTIGYTLGTYSTADTGNNNKIRLIIIFNDSTYSITNLTSA